MMMMWETIQKGRQGQGSSSTVDVRDIETCAHASGTDSDRPHQPPDATVPLVPDHLSVESSKPASDTKHSRNIDDMDTRTNSSSGRPSKRQRLDEYTTIAEVKDDSVADYLPEFAEPPVPHNHQSIKPESRLHGVYFDEAVPADIQTKVTTNGNDGAKFCQKPMELFIFYDAQLDPQETPLFRTLLSFDPTESIFRSHFKSARYALQEVGRCASDLIWRRASKEIEATVTPVYEEDDDDHMPADVAVAKARLNVLDAIRNATYAMPNLDPKSRGMNVTPKFFKLVQVLKACEAEGSGFRGIVFVQRRAIAFVIVDLLRMLDDHIGFLRPHVLAGHGFSGDSCTKILDGFKAGTYNLLIATKSVEDMEMAPASIVIRYNLWDSQISYSFCRSRLRPSYSALIHMAEKGNDVHLRLLSQIATMDDETAGWMDISTQSYESAIPPATLQESNDPYRSDSDDEGDTTDVYITDPTTSAKLYPRDSPKAIYQFVSILSADIREKKSPLFHYETADAKDSFICTVLFPDGLPFTRISGFPRPTKSEARRSACYSACEALWKKGCLDCRFFPKSSLSVQTPQEPPSTVSDAGEDIVDKEDDESGSGKSTPLTKKSYGIKSYPRKKPEFWTNAMRHVDKLLFPAIIMPSNSDDGKTDSPYAPLLLLTRVPLPPLTEFNIFISGIPRPVRIYRGEAFEVDEARMDDLHKYTIRIFRAVMNKPLECMLENMVYFIAPLSLSWKPPGDLPPSELTLFNVTDDIQWNLVQTGAQQTVTPLQVNDDLNAICDDALVQDRWAEFTRRYFCRSIRHDLNPMSKAEDSPREKDYQSFYDYCTARRKGFEGLKDINQPMLQVEKVPMVLNNLCPTVKVVEDAKRHPAKYLIPELCAKFSITASTFRTAILLPSILRRLDDLLLVKELNAKVFNHMIDEKKLHTALSAPSAAIEFDYERLELLGDAYLKYLSSIYLFVTRPTEHEGTLHIARQEIISNKSLLHNAERRGLPPYIQSRPFTTKTWLPVNFFNSQTVRTGPQTKEKVVDEKPAEEGEIIDADMTVIEDNEATTIGNKADAPQAATPSKDDTARDNKATIVSSTPRKKRRRRRPIEDEHLQWLGDKGVADVAEAIIGAAYLSGGREVALKVTKALNVPVPSIERWSDFGRKALAPPPEVTAKLRDGTLQAVESIIGHEFRRPHLLAQALTHASIQGSNTTCYERLEFIGDAILDFLVIRYIYDRDCTLCPGGLTLLKGAMVSNTALAALSAWSGLHEHLLIESYSLANSIRDCVAGLNAKRQAEDELATKEGRMPGQYWLETEPPKALSDVIESILGAIYVSDNFSPIGAEKFFDKVLKPFYDRHIRLHTLSHHPTKVLFELFQARGCQDFKIVKDQINCGENRQGFLCDVIVHDVVLARAIDATSTFASRKVSLYAMDALEGDPGFMGRTCDCRENTKARRWEKKSITMEEFTQFDEDDTIN